MDATRLSEVLHQHQIRPPRLLLRIDESFSIRRNGKWAGLLRADFSNFSRYTALKTEELQYGGPRWRGAPVDRIDPVIHEIDLNAEAIRDHALFPTPERNSPEG